MNEYVAVTVRMDRRAADLALPVHIPVRTLLENLLPLMGVISDEGRRWSLGQKTPVGIRRIPDSACLGDLEITHGAILVLMPKETVPLPATDAYLETENGERFPLHGQSMVIGRNDPKSGTFVEIDLSAAARNPKAISRRHARIDQEGNRFYLTDLGSVNGTKLNGRRLLPNERMPLWSGDVIEFGRHAAQLVFYAGNTPQG